MLAAEGFVQIYFHFVIFKLKHFFLFPGINSRIDFFIPVNKFTGYKIGHTYGIYPSILLIQNK